MLTVDEPPRCRTHAVRERGCRRVGPAETAYRARVGRREICDEWRDRGFRQRRHSDFEGRSPISAADDLAVVLERGPVHRPLVMSVVGARLPRALQHAGMLDLAASEPRLAAREERACVGMTVQGQHGLNTIPRTS